VAAVDDVTPAERSGISASWALSCSPIDTVIDRHVGNTIDVVSRGSYFGDPGFVYRSTE
jgi:hypothetical protein